MDSLRKKVQHMQISMEILDGNDDNISDLALSLNHKIEEGFKQNETFKRILQEYQNCLEDKKRIMKEMDDLKRSLLGIYKYFPEGLVTALNNDESVESGMNTSLVNGSSIVNINAGDFTYQQENEHYGKVKTPLNIPVKSVLSERKINNIQANEQYEKVKTPLSSLRKLDYSEVTSNSHLQVPSITLSTSKNDTKPTRKNSDISVSYVTEEEFSHISSYMKGRLTLATVNEFVDMFNATLNKKYELIKKSKKLKSKPDLDQCLLWKEQEKGDLIGNNFLTAEDFDKLSSIKIGNKKYMNIITILRHTKRMKEIRNVKRIYYVACY